MGLLWLLAFSIQSLFLHSLFSLTVTNSFPSVKSAPCLDHESSALLQLRESFVISKSASYHPFSYPKTASWIPNTDCCAWDGVECDELTGHVIELDLSSSHLYGFINSNSSLFQLAQLQSLNLADNDFNHSPIPSKLGDLSMLKHLNLSTSKFLGEIPPKISQLSKLVSLDLTSNVFSPYTPINLLRFSEPNLKRLVQNSTNLERLFLNYVTIASHVPDILANQTSLIKLSLYNCELYGEFPVGIFYLPKLRYLVLGHNPNLSGKLPEFHSGGPINVLKLTATNFSGTLPSSIGNLSSLKSLSISQCKFSGSVPSSLGNLTQLKHLDIRENNFEGHLPSSLSNLKNLRTFQVGYNKLSSQTISWIGLLTRLNYLDLSRTNIGTKVPISIANLTLLINLNINFCNLNGEIPFEIMNLTNLISLHLVENNLSGKIPPSLFELEKLEYLALGSNRLSGQLDFNMFLKLKGLIFLSLSYNNLTLFTKTSSSNITLPQIQVLSVASCNITKFPEFLQGQDELGYLYMSHNYIRSVPSWFWSKKSLKSLYISNNSLAGEMSPMICNFKSLELLDLSLNSLSGMIPSCLGSFSQSLRVLKLGSNNLFSLIPQSFVEGNALKMIDFSQNNLQGQLPKTLANCRMLEFLDVSHNQINDSFPCWLGTLPELKVLALRYNKFYGAIRCQATCTFPKLHIIDLSHNDFVGKFPTKAIQGWKSIRASDVNALKYEDWVRYYKGLGKYWSENQIYSFTMNNKGIEMVYERLQQFYSFIAIDFSCNKISGEIPEAIGDLSGLVLLNLSNNILTGGIPSSIRKLSQLEALDLSHNNLSGKIPSELAEITFLEFFDVSYNNLRGPIPKGNQFGTFSNNSFVGNQGLCGDPLPKKCEDASSSLAPSGFDDDQDSKCFFEFGWTVVLMGYGCGFAVGLAIGCTLSSQKQEWLIRACRRKWQSRK